MRAAIALAATLLTGMGASAACSHPEGRAPGGSGSASATSLPKSSVVALDPAVAEKYDELGGVGFPVSDE